MFNKRYIAHIKEEGVLAVVKTYDLITEMVTVENDDGGKVLHITELDLLQEVGEINGLTIFNRDVIKRSDDRLLEVELQDDGDIVFHLLTDDLEREFSGTPSNPEKTLKAIEKRVELVGSIYELESEEEVEEEKVDTDFNIKVVKEFNGQYFTYYYACNNEKEEEIDLIKVVFVGHRLLEEEKYDRISLSYNDYKVNVENGYLVEVSQQELANYAYGMLAGVENEVHDEDEAEDADVDCDNCNCAVEERCDAPVCYDCERHEDHCICTPW